MSASIKLSNSSLVAIVDEDIAETITSKCWIDGSGYVATSRNRKPVAIHRIIMAVTDGSIMVDHKNRNKLDNRRCNLRLCNQSQNIANRPLQHNNKTGFRGVSIFGNKYRCTIMVQKKQIYMGLFDCPVVAAKKYDEAAWEHFGEFAVLNFPESRIA